MSAPGPRVAPLPEGLRGFDANTVVSAATAAAYVALGFRFAVRYVKREQPHSNDITTGEALTILDSGMALMLVQHVQSAESWRPTIGLGDRYGQNAADHARSVGYLSGATLWCDLEGVALGTPAKDVIDYCNHWWQRVKDAGFEPGLYVGWRAGLSAHDLYSKLKFSRYWAAYNLNRDQYPATRGVQMQQGPARAADKPAQHAIDIDTDLVQKDAVGDLPLAVVPCNWLVG
jgi:hypothetical protein